MEPSGGTDKQSGYFGMSAFGRTRRMFGSKRRMIAPLIVAAVLMAAVGLFMMVSDSLLMPALRGQSLDYLWNLDSMPPFITPTGQDWITPEGELPEARDLFTVTGAENTVYLRCFAATTYDGKLWKKYAAAKSEQYRGQYIAPGVTGHNKTLTDNITISPLVEFSPGFIPTSLYTTSVSSPDELLLYPKESMFYLGQASEQAYSFATTHYYFSDAALKGATVINDASYLQLPNNITQRTRDLAVEITKDYSTPYEKATAIQAYLQNNYEYSVEYTALPGDLTEATDWFLFEDKKGIHTHFSSAYVVLARCVGLPTRLVSGYFIESKAEEQTVNTLQAFCVAEVGYKDLGWIIYSASPFTGEMGINVQTFTYIDGISDAPELNPDNPFAAAIEKDKPFYVIGRVETESGISVLGMPVAVWLWQGDEVDKPEFVNGFPNKLAYPASTQLGIVTNDGYVVECQVPRDLIAGNWNVIVNAIGIPPLFLPSDSDPAIIIKSPSEINALLPSDALVGQPYTIAGALTDATNPLIPVSGVQVNISIKNIDTYVEVASLSSTTSSIGNFVVLHTFADVGDYLVTVSFAGNDYYLPDSVSGNVKASIATELTLDLPYQVKLDYVLPVTGTLSDSLGRPLAGRTVDVYYDDVLLDSVSTDAYGDYQIIPDYTFNLRGEHTFRVEYSGQEYYLPDVLQHDIRVYGPPTLELNIPTEADEYDPLINNYFDVHASLIDEFDDPLSNTDVLFYMVNGGVETYLTTLTTDTSGMINARAQGFTQGTYTIKAVFTETALYPGTEDSASINIWMPTTLSMDPLTADIKLGTTLTIEGYLLDYWGVPVSGKTIRIMNGASELTTVVTDGSGHYAYDHIFTPSGIYDIHTSFAVDAVDLYKASTTAHQTVTVYGPPTIDLTVPVRRDINAQPVTISGHIYDEYGNDLVGYTVIIQYTDGSADDTLVTGAGGLFSTTHTFAAVGDYTVTAVFNTQAHYPAASESAPIKMMMPTVLTVSVPAEAKVNTFVTISGTLLDAYGSPLAGHSVALLDGSAPITTVVTLGDGSYSYNHTFTASGDHTVNAVFAETGYLKLSSASDGIRVYGPPTIDLTVPVRRDINAQPVTISGHIYDEYGNDLVGYTVIIQYTDGSADDTLVTGAGGLFSTTHTFAAVGDYTVTAVFNTQAHYPAASESAPIKMMMPTVLTVSVPAEAKVNTFVTISGTLLDAYGSPLAGHSVALLDGSAPITTVVTLGDGSYSYNHTFTASGDHTVNAVFAETGYLKLSSASDGIRVYGPPTIHLAVPTDANEDQSVTVSGYLDDQFGNRLLGYTVDIAISDGTPVAHLTTNAEGRFSLVHAFNIIGDYTVTASFAGAGYYPPASNAAAGVKIMRPTTLTLDVQADARINTDVTISGVLTQTVAGAPVAGQTVKLYDGITLIATLTTDADGDYSLTHAFGSRGGHQLSAVFEQAGYFRTSSAFGSVQVRSGTVVVLDFPDEADIGSAIDYELHLYDEFDTELLGHTVNIYINSGSGDVLVAQPITTQSGLFSMSNAYTTTGDYTVTAVYAQNTEYLNSQDSAGFKIMMPTIVTINAPAVVKVGEQFTISGTLQDVLGNPVSGMTLIIRIHTELDGGVATDDLGALTNSSGQYAAENTFYFTAFRSLYTSFITSGYYKGSQSGLIEVIALNEPTLVFDMPQQAEQFSNVDIGGTLIDELLGPVEGALITIDTGDGTSGQITTDEEGAFTLEHVYMSPGDYTITASYAGFYPGLITSESWYVETQAIYGLSIIDADYRVGLSSIRTLVDIFRSSYFLWIVAGLALAAAGYVAYLVIRRVRSIYAFSVYGGGIAMDRMSTPAARAGKQLAMATMEIEFPQAQPPMANVWGINDELEIAIRLFDGNGVSLASRSMEISANGRRLGQVVTGGSGSAVYRHIFKTQGAYDIGCIFDGDRFSGPCSQSRMIKIVDYREEAIGLFNIILRSTKMKNARISKKLTPREIERMMVSSFRNIDKGRLDRFIGYVEETLYSSHDFTRESYVAMLDIYNSIFAFIEEA